MTIRKITAVLALFTMLFAPCQKVFADTDTKRQEALNKLALMLSDKKVKLDDKEDELRVKEANLEELSQKIHAKDIAATVREKELNDLKDTLDMGSRYLAADRQDLEHDQQLLAERKIEVDNAQKIADDTLRRASDDLALAQDKLTEAENLKKVVDDRIAQIHRESADLAMKYIALEISSGDVAAKKAQLAQDREKLESEQKLYAEKQKELQQIITTLNAMKDERDATAREVAALKTEAAESAAKLDRLIEATANQQATIAMLNDEISRKFQDMDEFYRPNISVVIMGDDGVINWSDGSIRAKGHGVPSNNVTPSQGKLLARRAAILDLQRNMLETIKGVQIDAKTTMNKFMVEVDSVSSAVSGTISGVEIISEDWNNDEGIYTVTGQIRQVRLAKAMDEISKRIPKAANKPKNEGRKDGARFTGLIVDVRNLPVDPQKFFRIVDEKGRLVYGNDYADRNIQSRIGLCAYYDNRVFIADEQARVGDNPLFIKAQRISSNGEDIVITTADAETIRHNRVDFRKDCKVIIVRS